MSERTIRSVITPNDQFLRTVFSVPKSYFIDIYQREYKWTPENVDTLLRDIESHFITGSRDKTDPREIQAVVQEKFEPYFLNTYLTHSTAANISIVDGQQRLTTFLLIFIRLYQILKEFEVGKKEELEGDELDPYYEQQTFSSRTLEKLIFESDDFGYEARFKIFNRNREDTLRELLNEKPIEPKDETQQRMRDNFDAVINYFESFLGIKGSPGRYDITKLTYYITYLLDRISIVEIKIEKQQNVATIFEVVNDRGLGLKPYEILKGKLIGNLPDHKKEHANEVWTRLQDDYFKAEIKNSTESKIDLDLFFRTYFRAKFADSEYDYEKFEGDYHYEIYRNSKIREYFEDFNNPDLLYTRIIKDIHYFANLYLHLRIDYENEYLIFNKLLDQSQQYLLILSCLQYEDPDREAKITGIARKFDQFHAILRLLDIYESSSLQRMVYPINRDIRNRQLQEAERVFECMLIENLEAEDVLRKDEVIKIEELFKFERFQNVRNRWTNFSKYVLLRIDRYLSKLLDKPSYAGGDLVELEGHFNKTTRRKYGMHLEHIYAYNDSNMSLFTSEGRGFDEQQFSNVRNLLGMVLLLKDRQNISSNNEIYTDKVETYKKSNFIWNELLVGHLHGVDACNIPETLRCEPVLPDNNGAFPRERVGERQRLLFNAIKILWSESVPSLTAE
jgi:uncharacterized protein with ParB-like and HNH nuclease domain